MLSVEARRSCVEEVPDDPDPDDAEPDPDDPDAASFAVYEYLSMLVTELVDALAR